MPTHPTCHRSTPTSVTDCAADIEERGVLVPVIIAHDGEVLDGRLRHRDRRGTRPQVRPQDRRRQAHAEAERPDLRLCVNVYRRQLNQAQVRELIAWALRKAPEASDRSCGPADRAPPPGPSPGSAGHWRQVERFSTCPSRTGRTGSVPLGPQAGLVRRQRVPGGEARRLLGELGRCPGPAAPRKGPADAEVRAGPGRATGPGRAAVRLGDDFKVYPATSEAGRPDRAGTADLLSSDPPGKRSWGQLAQVAARLLKPDGSWRVTPGSITCPTSWRFPGGRAAVRVDRRRGPPVPGDPQRRAGEEPVDADPCPPQRARERPTPSISVLEDVSAPKSATRACTPGSRSCGPRSPWSGRCARRAGWWSTVSWPRQHRRGHGPGRGGPAVRRCEIDPRLVRAARSRVPSPGGATGRVGDRDGDGCPNPTPRLRYGRDQLSYVGVDRNIRSHPPTSLTEAPVLPPLPAPEYARLRDSIRDRGVLQPLLITSDHVLIDGHERWRAICELGMVKDPLRVVGNLDEAPREGVGDPAQRRAEAPHSRAERRRLLEMVITDSPSRSTRRWPTC